MESPRKFNDCYFYYYSTCIKGDNCVFRHEPSALGCETMCTAWQQGKCLDKRCKLRHMELRKNRKQIPCYWENQPGGCRKKHCPFMHKNPDARTDGIAPSQPAPMVVATPAVPEVSVEPSPMNAGVPAPIPQPAPMPLLWQQQRQVVLDSAILGVLPSSDLLGARRVLPPHAHAHAHAHPHAHAHDAPGPYAPLPVDPLVVNFEEESDNESAPSSTPTKTASPDDHHKIARTKSQELLLLEKIQAEAAAFYSYETQAPEPTNERKIVRTNLTSKYDKISLDELAGKQNTETRNNLDFKVLSLDEIRAKKKVSEVVKTTPITLNLNRKRKLSTQEINTTTGNKIIKVVRSNSIVYKKFDKNAPPQHNQNKTGVKRNENLNRKRTLSEQSDIYEQEDIELVDNCYEFKRIKIGEHTSKPRLIRNRQSSNCTTNSESKDDIYGNKTDNDSDSEVQFVSIEISECDDKLSDTEVIDVDTTKMADPVDIVDLCEDVEETDMSITNLDLVKNVPDVVASCHKKITDSNDKDLLNDIDALLDDDL
ncbi:Zinc finger CCCH domain-containing protein 11A [Papilio xuthus]|uniref:Zinc finger CCCH domain-containing protein 11A n=1 Tax=Papilio xuthus TaxID=66420 RepID=A0A194PXX2_PAPXU|nr:Zinc finger CCCH domain-containing protein 11A [Papilio xuthus]